MKRIPTLIVILLLTAGHLLSSQTDTSRTFQIAWLTDTHVGASTGYEDLKIVTRDIQADTTLDFAIVSGDVSEMDVGNNLIMAKGLLDSMDLPYVIIPGNHDTKWSDSGGGRFEQLWGSDRFNIEIGNIRFIGVHQGPILRMADGYINPADIAWVDSILQALPDPRQKIFLVTHYPLDPSVDNWYALMDVIKPYNIQAILHGHGHANRIVSMEGIPGIMSRSTLRRKINYAGYTRILLSENEALFYERIPELDSLRLWHTLPLGDLHTEDSLRLPLPDYSANDTSHVTLDWQYASGSIITSDPVQHGQRVFATTTAGQVLALDLNTGKILWTWQGQGAIHATPAVRCHRLVVGSVDSTITCLSTRTGKLKWQTRADGPVLSSPLIYRNRVFIGSGNGVMRRLSLRTGQVQWASAVAEGYIEARPLLYKKHILFGAWDGSFYALDAGKGKLQWKWTGDRSGRLFSPAACQPVAAHGKVFIVAPDRAITAINVDTGASVWRQKDQVVREMMGMSEDGETVFARSMRDSVLAVFSAADSFRLKWKVSAGFGYDFAPGAMLEKNGRLYFGTKTGWVYCLDSHTGDLIWRYRISDGLVNTVIPIDTNSVLTTAVDGRVSRLTYSGSN